jgi:hypothetical protein
MEGPRAPLERELPSILEFLNSNLRPHASWSIATEYPTALTPTNLGNIRIITEGNKVISHSVLKPLIIKSPMVIFKVGAIGSVLTDSGHRGQGLSTQILNECLKEAKKQDCDIAMLWTNLYDFYRKLNFELAGFEESVIIEKEFTVDNKDLRFVKGTNVSPGAIYKLYSQHTVASIRTAEDIRKFLAIPNTTLYTAWDASGQLAAYAVEGKGADLTGYIHEWGGTVSKLMALFSHIRKEKKAPFTIILAQHALNLLSALKTIPGHVHNEGYLGMIKIVNEEQLFQKIRKSARTVGIENFLIEKSGEIYRLGIGSEIIEFTDEKELVRIVFGPMPEIPQLKPETMKTLERILPAYLWIWGWDSI